MDHWGASHHGLLRVALSGLGFTAITVVKKKGYKYTRSHWGAPLSGTCAVKEKRVGAVRLGGDIKEWARPAYVLPSSITLTVHQTGAGGAILQKEKRHGEKREENRQ